MCNDHTNSKQKVEKEKRRQMRKELIKRKVKDRVRINCKEGEQGKKTIAIATAVFLPSSNNCLMSDASS